MSKKSRAAIQNNLAKVLEPPPAPGRRGAHLDGLLDEYSPTEPSPASNVSLTPDTSLTPNVSLAPEAPLAPRGVSLAPDVSLVPDEGHTVDLWAGIGDIHTGYLRLYGVIVERLYRHIDPFEQAVYTQLYALSWGFGNPFCRVSWPKLAERAGMKQTAAFNAVRRLADKGLVRKGAPTLGRGKDQGNEFWLPLPARLADDIRLARNARHTPNVSIKEKNKKQDSKSVVCDLCKGTSGMIYPSGMVGVGPVKRCDHTGQK